MKYAFIQAHRTAFAITMMCAVMKVSVSGYYAWRKRPESERDRANQVLAMLIEQAFKRSRKAYGSPRVHQDLRQTGVRCGKHRVARLMQEHGWVARARPRFKPQTTDSAHVMPVANNRLDQDFTATQPNKKWVADITFIATQEGWLYLAVVLDVFSRRVVGWAMNERCDAALVNAALEMAQQQRVTQPGLIVHSDRGSQYASQDHREDRA